MFAWQGATLGAPAMCMVLNPLALPLLTFACSDVGPKLPDLPVSQGKPEIIFMQNMCEFCILSMNL